MPPSESIRSPLTSDLTATLMGFVSLAPLALVAATAQAADAAPTLEQAAADMAGIVLADDSAQTMLAHCQQHAQPATAQAVQRAYQAWQQQHLVNGVRAQVPAHIADKLSQQAAVIQRQVRERLAADGEPESVCARLAAGWGSSASMNLRQRYPAAYDASGQVRSLRATAMAAMGGQRADGGGPAARGDADDTLPGRPTGTVITPAQLYVMANPGGDRRKAGLQALGLGGRLFIRGRVRRNDDRYYLEQASDGWTARYSVALGLPLPQLVGRDVVVAGELDELPMSMVFLRKTRLVSDPGALTASTLPEAAGLRRAEVDTAKLTTEPGRGLQPGQVHGVQVHIGTANGYSNPEHAWLLLKDGTLYDRAHLPPADLNVARSRELEPQHWHRWRAAGSGVEWLETDDQGRPGTRWEKLPGTLLGPWPANSKPSGSFNSQRFYGNLVTGGTYFSDTLALKADGRFEAVNFSQSGSGSLASTNGFNMGSSSHSDGSGTSTTVAGGLDNTTTGGQGRVTATSSGRRNDGADHRGSYRVDGYTLELRYDSGQVQRLLSAPMGWSRPAMWAGEAVYSVKK